MAASEIEKTFSLACRAAGLKVEAEQMVGRYRPDFLIREHKVIVELDGAENHSSAEDRTNDAQRQRYLQKLGWTVLRFTGREIHRDAPACVAEVIDFVRGLKVPRQITPSTSTGFSSNGRWSNSSSATLPIYRAPARSRGTPS